MHSEAYLSQALSLAVNIIECDSISTRSYACRPATVEAWPGFLAAAVAHAGEYNWDTQVEFPALSELDCPPIQREADVRAAATVDCFRRQDRVLRLHQLPLMWREEATDVVVNHYMNLARGRPDYA